MSTESTGLSQHETPRAGRRTYTIEQVAEILGLSRNSAYVAARNGLLPCPVIKIGRRMVVAKFALDEVVGAA
jgi:hypothetical protein